MVVRIPVLLVTNKYNTKHHQPIGFANLSFVLFAIIFPRRRCACHWLCDFALSVRSFSSLLICSVSFHHFALKGQKRRSQMGRGVLKSYHFLYVKSYANLTYFPINEFSAIYFILLNSVVAKI